jgi:bacterioferritin-associated ferredoxin
LRYSGAREETILFVCVCNGITECQIREAMDRGARSLPELTAALGVAAGCGACADYTRCLLESGERTEDLVALPHAA